MILHFSHIGLTDGRTFTLIRSQNSRTKFPWILGPALATAAVAATAPKRRHAASNGRAAGAPGDVSKGLWTPVDRCATATHGRQPGRHQPAGPHQAPHARLRPRARGSAPGGRWA